MLTDPQYIHSAHHIPGRTIAAVVAVIGSATCLPLSAYGTRLRRIRFGYLNRTRRLIVQLLDDLPIAGARHLLCPNPSQLLRRFIEGLAHEDQRTWKGILYQVRRLVRDVLDAIATFVQQLVFASLQTLV